ncbi:MAG: hypothetical protein AB7T05_07735 [Fimbriimonadaceae bacterium]
MTMQTRNVVQGGNEGRRKNRSKARAILPLVALGLATLIFWIAAPRNATAQIETLPSWAVIDFSVQGPSSAMDVGSAASEALSNELAKAGNIDVVSAATTKRILGDLGYRPPLTKPADITRFGKAVEADTVVTGEIVNWRIVDKDGGKMAQALMRIVVWDVASGLVVNGAALSADSDVTAGDVSTDELLKAALAQGVFEAVGQINQRTLPSATVLNTLATRALINKGARAGFQDGQSVILSRGQTQVASAVVRNVDPDSAFIEIQKTFRGVQPGDKVRAIFDVPVIRDNWTKAGQPRYEKKSSGGSNAGLISLVVLLLAVGLLIGQGRGSNQDAVNNVFAEATSLNDTPAVKISWVRDAFQRGNNTGPVFYQVWRDGHTASPAAVVGGTQSSAYEDALGQRVPPVWYDFNGIVGGFNCDFTEPPEVDNDTPAPNIVAGTSYTYGVEVVYRVSSLDLPGSGSGGGTGGTGGLTTGGGNTGGLTTGGGNTGGLTTGGNTGGTTGGGNTGGTGGTGGTTGGAGYCYFASSRVNTQGAATPLRRPPLRSPSPDEVVTGTRTFTFESVRDSQRSIQLEYVVQFSDQPTFPRGRVTTLEPIDDSGQIGGAAVSYPGVNTNTLYPGATSVYWRVGVKNLEDNPGPVADQNGFRYIWSATRKFRRIGNPGAPRKG